MPVTIGALHGVAAAILFTCLALFPLLLFSQSRTRSGVYRGYGWAMIALLLLVVAYTFAPESLRLIAAPLRPILVLETLLIVVFGVSWFDRVGNSPERDVRNTVRSAGIPSGVTACRALTK
jgi:hypothetical protein